MYRAHNVTEMQTLARRIADRRAPGDEKNMFLPMQSNSRSVRRRAIVALVAFGVATLSLSAGVTAFAHPILPGATLITPQLTLIGQAVPSDDEIQGALDKGDFTNAVTLSTQAITARPKLFKYYLFRGLAYYKLGQFDKAAADDSKVIELVPNRAEGYLNRAYAYKELGKPDEGLADLAKVATLDKTRLDVKLRGDLNLQKKAYPAAIADYSIVEQQPGEEGAIGSFSVGDTYAAQKDMPNAITAYTKGITKAPKNPYGYFQRGFAYINTGKPELAVKDLTQYITLQPDDPDAYRLRGVANASLKTDQGYAAAKTDFAKYIATGKDPAMKQAVTRSLAKTQFDTGDYASAIASYTKLIAADKNDSKSVFLRGMASMQTKDYPSAVKDFTTYQASFASGSDAADAAFNLGSAYLALTPPDYPKADQAFSTAIKLNPADTSSYYGRLVAEFNQKQYDKVIPDADQVFKNATPAEQKEVTATYKLQAVSYDEIAKAKNDKATGMKAVAAIKKYLTLNPKDEQAQALSTDFAVRWLDPATVINELTAQIAATPATNAKGRALLLFNRGANYLQTNSYDKAAADYTEVIKLTPTDDEAYLNRASAYLGKGDDASVDLAIADYSKAIALKPEKTDLLLERGVLYVNKKKDFAKADADYTSYLAKAGDKASPETLLTQAQLKKALNKPDEAIVIYGKYLALEKDPAKQADASKQLGYVYLVKADYPNAIKTYSDYLAKNSKDVVALSNRAQAYLLTNDLEKATADLNAALAVEPNSAAALTQRGWVNSKKGDAAVKAGDPKAAADAYDAAIADCDKAAAADAKYALAYYRKGFAAYKNSADDAAADEAKYLPLALDAFQKYVANSPATDPEVAKVNKLIADLKAQIGK